jgi:hypothetical protein
MTNPIERSILIVGMPSTGKTSFLAALQHYVETDLKDKPLNQYKYSPDSEYLNKIHNRWLNCHQQSRTIQENEANRKVEMFLEDCNTKERFTLNIPDIAGETFTQHWELRSWEIEYKDIVERSSGILFFIHPENIKAHSILTDVANVLEEFTDSDESNDIVQWNPSLSPTQVIAVDLLQQHLDYLPQSTKIPIALIISAWDTVYCVEDGITPNEWLELNMPLLHQFLNANSELLEFNTYGISAQGGDFNETSITFKLRELDEPAERFIVQEDTSTHKDISAPITWVIGKWKN